MVLEQGAEEDTAVAALLHDAAEDSGGQTRIDDIQTRFGQRVADIVTACSDTLDSPKPPWRERKEAFLQRIPSLSAEARMVNQADLLHNARSILSDLRANGAVLWERFRGGKEGTRWFYRQAIAMHGQDGPTALLEELQFVFAEIERIAEI
jgi:GTP pyrophosphokinase